MDLLLQVKIRLQSQQEKCALHWFTFPNCMKFLIYNILETIKEILGVLTKAYIYQSIHIFLKDAVYEFNILWKRTKRCLIPKSLSWYTKQESWEKMSFVFKAIGDGWELNDYFGVTNNAYSYSASNLTLDYRRFKLCWVCFLSLHSAFCIKLDHGCFCQKPISIPYMILNSPFQSIP